MNTITIDICPLCQKKHDYSIDVQYSTIVKYFTLNDLNNNQDIPEFYEVTRIFTCPIKNEEFESNIQFMQTSSHKIKNIGNPNLKDSDGKL